MTITKMEYSTLFFVYQYWHLKAQIFLDFFVKEIAFRCIYFNDNIFNLSNIVLNLLPLMRDTLNINCKFDVRII